VLGVAGLRLSISLLLNSSTTQRGVIQRAIYDTGFTPEAWIMGTCVGLSLHAASKVSFVVKY